MENKMCIILLIVSVSQLKGTFKVFEACAKYYGVRPFHVTSYSMKYVVS